VTHADEGRVAGPALVLVASTSVPAATRVVTKTNEAGPGSLRQAVDDANANPGPDTITFNIAGAGHSLSSSPASG